jgi:Transposase DDE domain group 1
LYNQRGTCEQYIKEGKNAIKWTRLSCRTFAANAVRLQLHVLAYNLGNFMRTLAIPKGAEPWSLSSLREKLIQIGAKLSATGATSRSSWPRSQSRSGCSPTSCR